MNDDISTVNLLLNLLTIVIGGGAILAGLWYARKKGTNAAEQRLIAVLEGEVEAVRNRANRLHDDNKSLQEERRELEKQIAELALRPDMTLLVEQLAKFHQDLVDKLGAILPPLAGIDRRLDRHEAALTAMTKTLEAIEGRINGAPS